MVRSGGRNSLTKGSLVEQRTAVWRLLLESIKVRRVDFLSYNFSEPDGPKIELFDLDEALSSQRVRLAQITNRCRPDEIHDLEVYYIFLACISRF